MEEELGGYGGVGLEVGGREGKKEERMEGKKEGKKERKKEGKKGREGKKLLLIYVLFRKKVSDGVGGYLRASSFWDLGRAVQT